MEYEQFSLSKVAASQNKPTDQRSFTQSQNRYPSSEHCQNPFAGGSSTYCAGPEHQRSHPQGHNRHPSSEHSQNPYAGASSMYYGGFDNQECHPQGLNRYPPSEHCQSPFAGASSTYCAGPEHQRSHPQGDEIDVGVEAEHLKLAKSKNPGTESVSETREKFFYLVGKHYLQTMKPQSKKEYDEFLDYLQKLGAIMTDVRYGSLVITVKCESLQILEDLWKDYSSGHLDEVVQNCFVTEKILKEMNLAELRLKTTMDIEKYNACKVYFEKVVLRG
ncbi:uncharacterized protein LOC111346799 isoform X2 [Stylophora pistillata]|uniref:uncharacterized protein LOC111346799 isoform X2 n=1 Tax=Stylophora pistillata TaxID=50429 RepID=UPI000C04168E|nr:uncharacterized protein LOC111346799 isoform X2 [Stylophora pistillata]